MSQSKKNRPDSLSVEKTPGSKAIDSTLKGKRTGFIIASVVIILILIIVGIGYYLSGDARYRSLNIITVDDTTIRMDYFIKRAGLAGADPMSMLFRLTHEQLIKLGAPRYGIEVSPEDIDQGLRIIASGGSGNISDNEFREWYRQQLNESKLSDAEYREITRTNLLAARLQEYLAERVPTVAEQVHLHAIILRTSEDAYEVRARWEAGEDFAGLAREVSLDEVSGEKGGDIGWFPGGVLSPELDYTAFSLNTYDVSEPIPYNIDTSSSGSEASSTIYYLIMVSEKDASRELDENNLQGVRSQALTSWLSEETQFHEIKYNFNSEIQAWINWQLSKSRPASSGTSGG
ncbi:peptidylprolyl isomerase [Chloroflexota bacterium]